jgi:hypothetical protein
VSPLGETKERPFSGGLNSGPVLARQVLYYLSLVPSPRLLFLKLPVNLSFQNKKNLEDRALRSCHQLVVTRLSVSFVTCRKKAAIVLKQK